MSTADADRLTEVHRVFFDCIGEGVDLTAAGYLPPAVVEIFRRAQRNRLVVDRQSQP